MITRRRWRWRQHGQSLLPASLAMLLVGLCYWLQLLQPLEQAAYGALFQWRGPLAWDDRVALITIDVDSLQSLGTFPWRRDRYTQLLTALEPAAPHVVVLDLILAESTADDAALAAAMRSHPPVVIASGDALTQPNATIAAAATAIGHVRHPIANDGWVRQVPTAVAQMPSLSLVSLQAQRLLNPIPNLPVDQPTLWPNWIGPIDQLPHYAFHDILEGNFDPAQLRHKIILVGVTAPGFNPLITPFDRAVPASGVHLQATLLNNLLQQNLLHPLSGAGWLGLLLLSNGLWSIGLSRWRSTIAQVGSTALLVTIWWGIALGALWCHCWLPVALPIALWLSTAVIHWIISNQQLAAKNRQLTYLANIDELTQVANRRAFEQYLQQEWQRSLREQQPISLILCDVDFFKQFNDTYGHLVGDQCLYQVAQALVHSTKRPTDLIARYGGEEFAVILPNTSVSGAQKLTYRILSEMRSQLIPHKTSDISHYLTLSLGSATVVATSAADWHSLIDAADRGLYAAKAQGRDRACHTTTPNPIHVRES
jgi:diguanylate cyclase (GGDEF)-like protein